jgi:hypothetical protein
MIRISTSDNATIAMALPAKGMRPKVCNRLAFASLIN